jgi:cytochrome c-type biogenesis protein CcmH/NrfG
MRMLQAVLLCLQLDKDVEEVGPETLVVEVLATVLRDLDGLVLRQLGGAGDVQEQSTQLGERRLFVSATGRSVIVAAALGSATVVTAVVVVSVICVLSVL